MEQTFIVKFMDKNNNTIDFFRHGQKQLTSVLKQEKNFFTNEYKDFKLFNCSLFKKLFDKDIKIKVYQTEYAATDNNLVFEQNFIEFLNQN